MTNSNGDFNPVLNNSLPPELAHWSFGLDYNDDEFRAGYPFPDLPKTELSGSIFSIRPLNSFIFVSRQSRIM